MFGYVRPVKCELKIKEWDMYQALYCGLCHALKERCGFAARFTVNYDFTFLALVMSAVYREEFCIETGTKFPIFADRNRVLKLRLEPIFKDKDLIDL